MRVGLAAAGLALALAGWGVSTAIAWWPDYGPCVQSHPEARHEDAWLELRTHDCGKECSMTIPIWHPDRDWTVTVCDAWRYPDGNGPGAGRKRAAAAR